MEQAHIIDAETHLTAISNLPAGSGGHRVAVLLINAGFLHRVGPNRINTSLARQLADEGIASLRLDLSGIGDSMNSPTVIDNQQLVAEDLKKAMDFLQQQFAIERFVLTGLCSGAYDTFQMALVDDRVIGLVNIDGSGYRTRRFYLRHVALHLSRRLLDRQRWQRLWQRYRASRQVNHSGDARDQRTGLLTVAAFTDLTREQTMQQLCRLVDRGVRMRFVYSGGVSGFYNYRNQFRDMYREVDFKGLASTRYFPSTDHLHMLEHHRIEVLDDVVGWVCEQFPAQ